MSDVEVLQVKYDMICFICYCSCSSQNMIDGRGELVHSVRAPRLCLAPLSSDNKEGAEHFYRRCALTINN